MWASTWPSTWSKPNGGGGEASENGLFWTGRGDFRGVQMVVLGMGLWLGVGRDDVTDAVSLWWFIPATVYCIPTRTRRAIAKHDFMAADGCTV